MMADGTGRNPPPEWQAYPCVPSFLVWSHRLIHIPGQDERIEELRDIHRLESKSQSDQIEKLKAQVDEAEKLLKAAEDSSSQVEQEAAKSKAEIDRLKGELEKAIGNAKDEEEKRSKAIALLKTVRQKLVKAEKDRDDAMKEVAAFREADKVEREKEKAERTKLHAEIDKVNTEREIAVQGLRAQFDKEVAALKEKHDKEIAALRSQYELEAITTKVRMSCCIFVVFFRSCVSFRRPTSKKLRARKLGSRTLKAASALFPGRRTSYSISCSFARRRWSPYDRHWSLSKAKIQSCSISYTRLKIVFPFCRMSFPTPAEIMTCGCSLLAHQQRKSHGCSPPPNPSTRRNLAIFAGGSWRPNVSGMKARRTGARSWRNGHGRWSP